MVTIHLEIVQLVAIGFLWGVQLTCLSLYWASDIKLAFRQHRLKNGRHGHD